MGNAPTSNVQSLLNPGETLGTPVQGDVQGDAKSLLQPGETLGDPVQPAAQQQQTAGDVADASPVMRPEQMQNAAGVAGGLAAIPAGAKLLDSALQYLGFGAKAAAAEAPQVVSSASKILDQYGQPFMKLVSAAEPEVQPTLSKILTNPGVQKAIKVAGQEILKGVGLGGGYAVLHKLLD